MHMAQNGQEVDFLSQNPVTILIQIHGCRYHCGSQT